MPRITYHDRFASLLAKDYITSRDRTFAESLYSHYKRKGSLTVGRRRCFVQMEERYATRPTPKPGASALDGLLKNLEATAESGVEGWNYKFVASIQAQLRSGRDLSERQTEILDKVKGEFSTTSMAERVTWAESWDAEKAERYGLMMQYYDKAGQYYMERVRQWHANKAIIPTKAQYEKITTNKYASKIFAGWYGAPKFTAGTMVALSASAGYYIRRLAPSGLVLVIKTNAAVPDQAARGNKVYTVLPIGSATPFNVNESMLKRAPKLKKKKQQRKSKK